MGGERVPAAATVEDAVLCVHKAGCVGREVEGGSEAFSSLEGKHVGGQVGKGGSRDSGCACCRLRGHRERRGLW
jgi:hypothetical protein